ncbi:hypothetical protein pb186bvf_018757 [Paramecium bursaria]
MINDQYYQYLYKFFLLLSSFPKQSIKLIKKNFKMFIQEKLNS